MEENNNRTARKNAGKRSHRGNFLIFLGLIMIIGALGLTAYNIWDGNRAEQAANQISDALIDKIKDDDSAMQVPMFDPATPMPSVEIDGVEYIGILEIPSLDLRLPVTMEWDYNLLKTAVCRITGSYYSDDLVICGHNYTKVFSPIKWIDIGEDVYLTTVEGMMIHYIITNRETLEPTNVEAFVSNIHNSDTSTLDWDMTLFTCNIGGQTRCAVRCSRVEGFDSETGTGWNEWQSEKEGNE